MSAVLERKRVPLGREATGPFVNRFLVLDYDGETFRVAYYRLRAPKEDGHHLHEDAWRLGVELGWFPEKGKPSAWVRSAAARSRLSDAIRIALDGVAPDYDDPRGIEAYIRSTGWGAELP